MASTREWRTVDVLREATRSLTAAREALEQAAASLGVEVEPPERPALSLVEGGGVA